MTTTTSSSNRGQLWALTRFALRKNIGWMAIYSCVLFLCYPLVTFQNIADISYYNPDGLMSTMNTSHIITSVCVSALLCLMALVFSALLFSYMQGRPATFFHSLPVKRETLLLSQFIAGYVSLVGPVLLSALVNLGAFALYSPKELLGTFVARNLLDCLAWAIGGFILLALCALVAVTVSTPVESLGYSLALLLEGSGLLLIWDLSCSTVFQTWTSLLDNVTTAQNLLYYLSPVFALAKAMMAQLDYQLSPFWAWKPLLLWLALGLGALLLALRQYHRRPSERAQQWGRQSLLGSAVKLVSALFGSFLLGGILGDMLGFEPRYYFLFGALTGAPLTFLLIEGITNRGFHDMKKCLPSLAVTLVAALAFGGYFATEGFGFDRRIPQAENLDSVQLELWYGAEGSTRYNDAYAKAFDGLGDWSSDFRTQSDVNLTETESIQLITDLNREALDRESGTNYLGNSTVQYRQGLSRKYRTLTLYSNSKDSLLDLLYSDEMLEKRNPFFELQGEDLLKVSLSDKMESPIGSDLAAKDYDALLSAIRSDLRNSGAETAGRSDNALLAYVNVQVRFPKEIYERSGRLYHYDVDLSFPLQESDSNTRLLLEELGYDLQLQAESLEKLQGVSLEVRGYTDQTLTQDYSVNGSVEVADWDKYDNICSDPQLMEQLLEAATLENVGSSTDYLLFAYEPDPERSDRSLLRRYSLNRERAIHLLAQVEDFVAPYVPDADLAQELVRLGGDADFVHYNPYPDGLEPGVQSLYDYLQQREPQLLEGRSQDELSLMKRSPYVMTDGTLIRLNW